MDDRCLGFFIMKKFVPYLLFTATTLHTVLGISPVMAMSCSSHSDKAEIVCEKGDADCQKEISASTTN